MKKQSHNALSVNEMAVTRIPEYGNKEFAAKIKNMAHHIYNYRYNHKASTVIKDAIIIDYSEIPTSRNNNIETNESEPYGAMVLRNIGVSWLHNLIILVNESSKEDNFMTVGNSGLYYTSFVRNNGKIIETKFTWVEKKFDLLVNGTKCPVLLKMDDCIELATLCFSIKNYYSERDLYYILYHELTHVYQMIFFGADIRQQTKSEVFLTNNVNGIHRNSNIEYILYNETYEPNQIKLIK